MCNESSSSGERTNQGAALAAKEAMGKNVQATNVSELGDKLDALKDDARYNLEVNSRQFERQVADGERPEVTTATQEKVNFEQGRLDAYNQADRENYSYVRMQNARINVLTSPSRSASANGYMKGMEDMLKEMNQPLANTNAIRAR